MAVPKSQFKNTSGGILGATTLDGKGEPKGIPLWPDETIWLSEEEQALTANAPRHEEDNPFKNGKLTLLVRAQDVPTSRPIGDDQDIDNPPPPAAPAAEEPEMDEIREEQPPTPEESSTGAPPESEAPAPEGGRAQNEEAAVVEEKPGDPADFVSPDDEGKVEEAPLDTTADRGAGVRPSSSPVAPPPAPDPMPGPPESAD
jgi:hypothetical protein